MLSHLPSVRQMDRQMGGWISHNNISLCIHFMLTRDNNVKIYSNTCGHLWVWVFSELRTGKPVKCELFANSNGDWLWRQWSCDMWFTQYEWCSCRRDLVNSEPQMANSLHQSHMSINSKSMWERCVFNIMFGYGNWPCKSCASLLLLLLLSSSSSSS